MECSAVQGKLSCYFDGVLDEAMLEAVESHLENCPECRVELESMRVLVGLVGEAEEVEPPLYLRQAIMESVRSTRKQSTCHQIEAVLSDYIDSELPESMAATVREHIAVCEDCAYELETLQSTVKVVSTVGYVEPPEGLCDSILASVAEKQTVMSSFTEWISTVFSVRRLAWVSAASVAVAVVLALAVNSPETMRAPSMERAVIARSAPAPEQAPVRTRSVEKVAGIKPERVVTAIAAHKVALAKEIKQAGEPVRVVLRSSPDIHMYPSVNRSHVRSIPAHRRSYTPRRNTPVIKEPAGKPVVSDVEETALEGPVAESGPEVRTVELKTGEGGVQEPESKPALVRIVVAPDNPTEELRTAAASIKKEADSRHSMQRGSAIRLFGKRF